MSVTVFTRKYSSGKYTLYLKINYKGRAWLENTGLHTGIGKFENKSAEKTAQLIAKKREVELANEEYGLNSSGSVTLKEYFNQFISLKPEKASRKYRDMIKKLYQVIPERTLLKSIKPSDIKRFIEHCESEYANSTIYKDLTLLRSVFKSAKDDDVIRINPMTKIKYKQDEVYKSYLTRPEIRLIQDFDLNRYLTTLRQDQHRKYTKIGFVRDLFLFQCFTGLRISDTKEMNYQIDLDNDRITKRMQKTGSIIQIPLISHAKEILLKYLDDDIPTISNQKYNKNLKIICAFVGIDKNVTSHTARHTFVTQLIASGVDIYTVKELVGHRDIKTTQLYAKLVDRKTSEAMGMYERYLK